MTVTSSATPICTVWTVGVGELGFLIGIRARWGEGLGHRAAAAAIEYGFRDLRLDEVWAEALDANQRSIRLLQRLGMRETGRGDEGEFLGQPSFYRQFTLTSLDQLLERDS